MFFEVPLIVEQRDSVVRASGQRRLLFAPCSDGNQKAVSGQALAAAGRRGGGRVGCDAVPFEGHRMKTTEGL